MDILNCLHADHRQTRELMAELEIHESDFAGKRRAFARLSAHFDATARAENAVVLLYALSSTESDDELRAAALKALHEHDLAELLAEGLLSKAPMSEEVWDAQFKVYSDLVDRHLDEEEHEIFPELYERLTEDERLDMGERYQRALKASRKACLSQTARLVEHPEIEGLHLRAN